MQLTTTSTKQLECSMALNQEDFKNILINITITSQRQTDYFFIAKRNPITVMRGWNRTEEESERERERQREVWRSMTDERVTQSYGERRRRICQVQ